MANPLCRHRITPLTEPANRLNFAESDTVQDYNTLTLTKDELLQAMDYLCALARDYGNLLDTLSSGEPARDLLLLRFNADRERLVQSGDPEIKTGLILAFARHLLRRMEQSPLRFNVPNRIGDFASRDNPELLEYSNRLRKHSEPIAIKLQAVMELADELAARRQDGQAQLLTAAHSLFKAVLRQDWTDVTLMLAHINLTTSTRERHELVRRIAKIARDIYNSLNSFSREISFEGLSSTTEGIPDAVTRLRSVIEHLEQAANANLDALERLSAENQDNMKWVREAIEVGKQCQSEYEQIGAEHPEFAQTLNTVRGLMRDRIEPHLAALQQDYGAIQESILAMIANQGFQDLTGQTLQKVIELVKSLQFELIALLKRYTGDREAPGPAEPSESTGAPAAPAPEKQSQEDVDKLLTELGF